MRIIQLSDTHISHLGGTPSRNMALLTEYLNTELRPDLVINTGDLVIANPDSQPDRQTAWELHQKIDAPLLVLPGNHDAGESAPDPWMGIPVTSDRVAAFTGTWGPDRFFRTCDDDWVLIGTNSERMSSGLPEETEQWDWLAGAAERARGKSVMLFLHKPLWFPGGSGPSGIVEYRLDGDDVQVTFRPVPGLTGVEDVSSMPEFTAAMAERPSVTLFTSMVMSTQRRSVATFSR